MSVKNISVDLVCNVTPMYICYFIFVSYFSFLSLSSIDRNVDYARLLIVHPVTFFSLYTNALYHSYFIIHNVIDDNL